MGPRAVWTREENLAPPPPGFDLWTAQPAASRYTDWLSLSTLYIVTFVVLIT